MATATSETISTGDSVLGSFTRLSKALALVLVSGFFISILAPFLNTYLALVPGKTLPCVWNIVTAGYYETNIWMVLINSISLLILARYLEPIWGSREFLIFVFTVNAATGFSAFLFMMSVYFMTASEAYLYGSACGFHGVIAGMVVAVKQLLPEHEVRLLAVLNFKLKQLPLILACALILLFAVTGYDLVTFSLFGMFWSWVYLRFYQEKPGGGKGDTSEAFSFSSFFPALTRPVIDKITAPIYKALCPGHLSREVQYSLAGAPLPGSDQTEAQRRRERGARALEERLNAKAAMQSGTKETSSGSDQAV